MSSNSRNNQRGFTLIEVLISLAVMVFISFGIYQATTETYRLRDILTYEGDFYNGIRLALDILQRDISSLYSPAMMAPSPAPGASTAANPFAPTPGILPQERGGLEAGLPGDLGQTTQFWGPALDKSGIRPSRFVGTDTKLSFISASHLRIYKDSPESDFAKVTYELVRDEGEKTIPDAKILIKTENTDVFNGEDLGSAGETEFIHKYKLLRGITRLRFMYYKRDGNTWKTYSSWDSDKEELKNTYPDIIEVDLGVSGPYRLSFEGKYKFRPEAPLRGLNPST